MKFELKKKCENCGNPYVDFSRSRVGRLCPLCRDAHVRLKPKTKSVRVPMERCSFCRASYTDMKHHPFCCKVCEEQAAKYRAHTSKPREVAMTRNHSVFDIPCAFPAYNIGI